MTTKITHRWAEFAIGGRFLPEHETVAVTDIAPKQLEWPSGAYSVRYYERDDVEHEGKTYRGIARTISKTLYHPDSKVETLDEVRANPKATDILIRNMEINGWNTVVWCRLGNVQPFDPAEDEVLR